MGQIIPFITVNYLNFSTDFDSEFKDSRLIVSRLPLLAALLVFSLLGVSQAASKPSKPPQNILQDTRQGDGSSVLLNKTKTEEPSPCLAEEHRMNFFYSHTTNERNLESTENFL